MYELERHPLFSEHVDPASGVRSFLLKEILAPVQQHFYFVSDSVNQTEDRLWLTCAWPPSRPQSLAWVSLDPDQPETRHFPQAVPDSARPLLSPQGGVWFGVGPRIFHLEPEGQVEEVFCLPESYIQGRSLDRLATHLTLSADGEYLLLDGSIGNTWFVGTAHLESGEFQLIREFPSHHNHAQFSPVDSSRFLIARDQQTNPVSGQFLHHAQRTWLMNRETDEYRCVNPDHVCSPYHGACHEWWSRDGWLCYIDYDKGVYEMNVDTGERNHLWREPVCHAHCDTTRRYWCADESPYYWNDRPCQVLFLDRETGSRLEIESAMAKPLPHIPNLRGLYHVDPHPQFSPRDQWVVYTSTPQGRPTVALCPVEALKQNIPSG